MCGPARANKPADSAPAVCEQRLGLASIHKASSPLPRRIDFSALETGPRSTDSSPSRLPRRSRATPEQVPASIRLRGWTVAAFRRPSLRRIPTAEVSSVSAGPPSDCRRRRRRQGPPTVNDLRWSQPRRRQRHLSNNTTSPLYHHHHHHLFIIIIIIIIIIHIQISPDRGSRPCLVSFSEVILSSSSQELSVGLLVTICLQIFARLIAPVVTTTSIIISSNKIQNYGTGLPDCPGK